MRRKRGLGALCTLAVIVSTSAVVQPVLAQQVSRCDQGSDEHSSVGLPPKYAFLPDQVVSLPSKIDGAAIQIGIVRPRVPAGTRVPVIVEASPYLHALQTVDLRKCNTFLVENFVRQGFAVALVPVRGTGDSGGCFDLFGSRERGDLDEAVTWLGTRPWSNGSVAMIGRSYDGGTAWDVAATGNPYLKTIVPISGVPDVFDLLYGAGTPDFRGPGILSSVYIAENLGFIDGRTPSRNAETIACPDYAVSLAASMYSFLTGEEDPFGYWADRRYTDDILARYRGSVYLVQGLIDWNVNPGSQFPLIHDLQKRGVSVKMLLGQWGHSDPDGVDPPAERKDFARILLRWFDRWLKGKKVSTGPAVQVQDDSGRWRNEPSWPPPGRSVTLNLSPSGVLVRGAAPAGSVMVAPDPLHTQNPAAAQGAGVGDVPGLETLEENCLAPLCAAFRTGPYRSTHRITGRPRLRLQTVPLGSGGDVSAFLYAQGARGLRRIGWGQVDLRFPRGRGAARSVNPGEPLALDFVLQPLEGVVEKGERLVLMLSMGNTYNRTPSIPAGPVTIELGTMSSLTVVEADPPRSKFFAPPR